MELKYKSDLLSIKFFDPVYIPNFTVITGLNGTGKSQLLQALQFEHVVLGDIKRNKIDFFINQNFGLQNLRKPIENYITGLTELAQNNQCSFYKLTSNILKKNGLVNIESMYHHYVQNVYSIVNNLNAGVNPHIVKPFLQKLIQEVKKPIELLTIEELDFYYSPISYKNNFLINNLTKVFSDYWIKWELNSYNQYRNEHYSENHRIYTDQEFVLEFGEKPWDIMNNIISTFGSLEYKINNPIGLERGHDYKLNLISTKDPKVVIDFDLLSSGEKIMMALVSTLYKTKVDKQFPRLLLLDEIDASLHPSMAQSMLSVIQKELVEKKGLQVILITHSPSTIALAPDNSVFIMKKEGPNRIVKSTNSEALNILSEGFASLTLKESDLKVTYNISKSSKYVLLTEGITDKIILETAWQKLYDSKLDFDIQDCFDASFLRNLFSRGEIFSNYPDKTFVALFDFDSEGYSAWNNLSNFELIERNPEKGLVKKHKTNNCFALLLPVPNNEVKKQVVESDFKTFGGKSHLPMELMFYDISALSRHFINEPQAGGGNLIKFLGDKAKFAENVASLDSVAFTNFKPLFETIKDIFK